MAFRKLGWVEGENLVIERAYAETKSERLAGLAEELIRKRVEVIVTVASPEATVAAARATKSVPIVFISGVVWPVEQGLIESFARPARNVTGVTFSTGYDVSAKRMELLREIAPAAMRLSWIYPPDIQETVAGGRFDMTPVYGPIAKSLGFELRNHFVYKSEDIDTAYGDILGWRAHAITVGGSAHIYQARRRIADFANRNRLPSAFLSPDYVEAGGLLSYTSDFWADVFPRGIAHVDRILRGARPADLPVEQPIKFQLAVNLKTARVLGIRIPQSILLRADRLIE